MVDWTEDEDMKLRDMWNLGKRVREIADALGRSRNAVIGKSNRMDLPYHPIPRHGRLPGPQGPRKAKAAPRLATMPPRATETPPRDGVGFLEASHWHCRAIIGREDDEYRFVRFCGKTVVEGKSYCHDHAAAYYTKSTGGIRPSWR